VRKFCEYSCSFTRSGEERREEQRTKKGHWKPEEKRKSLYYISVITHSLALALGMGEEFLQETKGEF
jgi:hypothetical protein